MPAPVTANLTQEVTPSTNFYFHHLFAFTPECDNTCALSQFGVKGLSSDAGFLTQRNVHNSQLPKAILKALGTLVSDYEVEQYLHVNYESPELQAALMKSMMPLARVVIFCPPCVSAIVAAIAICKGQQDPVAEWLVRVECLQKTLIEDLGSHRLGCKCCPDSRSGLTRVQMIADTIADVDSGNHWAKSHKVETNWIQYMDRAWMEQLLYKYSEDTSVTKAGEPDAYAGLRQMLTFDGKARKKTIAVILADVKSGAWIINSKPFPVTERLPRAGEMHHLKKENPNVHTEPVERVFLGTFATKGALKRRRNDSPSPSKVVRPRWLDDVAREAFYREAAAGDPCS